MSISKLVKIITYLIIVATVINNFSPNENENNFTIATTSIEIDYNSELEELDQIIKFDRSMTSFEDEEVESVITTEIIQESQLDIKLHKDLSEYEWKSLDMRSTYDNLDKSLVIDYLSQSKYSFTNPEQIAEEVIKCNNDGLNPIFMIALIRVESGNGSSEVCRYLNNYTGTISTYGGYKLFSSITDNINHTKNNLLTNYLSEDGLYHEGYTVMDISENYCSDNPDQWSDLVIEIMDHAEDYLLNNGEVYDYITV